MVSREKCQLFLDRCTYVGSLPAMIYENILYLLPPSSKDKKVISFYSAASHLDSCLICTLPLLVRVGCNRLSRIDQSEQTSGSRSFILSFYWPAQPTLQPCNRSVKIPDLQDQYPAVTFRSLPSNLKPAKSPPPFSLSLLSSPPKNAKNIHVDSAPRRTLGPASHCL